MPTTLHNRIRTALENTPGLTQKGLAERMGLNPAAVNRMLYGRRQIMAEEVPVIESYLGIKLELSTSPSLITTAKITQTEELVPVLSAPDGKIIDWTRRHPEQFGLNDAYALYVETEDMAPRYFKGELVYIHPHRPIETGHDVLIMTSTQKCMLRRLAAKNEKSITLELYQPTKKTEKVNLSDVIVLQRVVGRG